MQNSVKLVSIKNSGKKICRWENNYIVVLYLEIPEISIFAAPVWIINNSILLVRKWLERSWIAEFDYIINTILFS